MGVQPPITEVTILLCRRRSCIMVYDVDPYLNSIKNNISRLTDEQKEEVRFWINLGVDIVAYYWEQRDKYKEKYSNNRIYNYDYETRLEHGFYDDGVAIITGKLRRGPHKGKWLSVLDFDSLEAFLKFAGEDLDYKKLGAITRIEYAGNLSRVHVFILSDKPFINKSKNGLEVKAGNPKKLLAFVSPSINKRMRKPYTVLGTEGIAQVTSEIYDKTFKRIANVIPGYGGGGNNAKRKYTNEIGQKILELIFPYYVENHRDHVLFGLSGLLRKSRVGLDACLELFALFPDNNDLERNRRIAEETYHKDIEDVAGYSYLKDTAMVPEDVIKEICEMLPQQQQQEGDEDTVDIVEDISEQIMAKYSFATIIETKDIWYFKDGVYVPYGGELIEREAEALYGYDLKLKVLTEVKGHIMRQTHHNLAEFDANPNIKNMQNCLYDFMKDEQMEHTPDYLSLKQIPFPYDPRALPKYFGPFLLDTLYKTDIKTLIELMAYTFYPDKPFEIITILLGTQGNNGKSVLVGLLSALHGEENISNTPLIELVENRYGLADVVGKSVNIDVELAELTEADLSKLKRLTGRQQLRVEQKNQKAYSTALIAKYWFCANKIPIIYQDSNALYKRFAIITLPNVFEIGKAREKGQPRIIDGYGIEDPNLIFKLSEPAELSGIFNILMAALRRVLKREPPQIHMNDNTIQKRKVKYQLSANPILAFGELGLDKGEDENLTPVTESSKVYKEDLYRAYKRFCTDNRLPFESDETFGKIFKKSKYYHGDDRDGSGQRRRYWMGIRIIPRYATIEENQETLQT
jgi:P4 family phage/plasmid primase-like protien